MKNKQSWVAEKLTADESHCYKIKRVVVDKKTKFQHAVIADTCAFGRCLIVDGRMRSAEFDEHIYHECLVHPAMILHGNVKETLVMGGGDGAVVRELLKYKDLRRVMIIDIDGELVNICKKYLPQWNAGAFGSPRTRLIIGDAKTYVETIEQKFELIISYLPTIFKPNQVSKLYTSEFYKKLKNRIREGGVLALQSGPGTTLHNSFHVSLYKTLAKLFKYCRPFYAPLPSSGLVWSFMICSDKLDALKFSETQIDERIKALTNSRMRFYDGMTHAGLFNINKGIREDLK